MLDALVALGIISFYVVILLTTIAQKMSTCQARRKQLLVLHEKGIHLFAGMCDKVR